MTQAPSATETAATVEAIVRTAQHSMSFPSFHLGVLSPS